MKRNEKHICENKIINADFLLRYFIANLIESIYDQKKKKKKGNLLNLFLNKE